MKIALHIPLILILFLSSCGMNKTGQMNRDNSKSNIDLEKVVLNFSRDILKDNLRVDVHERVRTYYWDIQMIFEADDFKSDHFNTFTTYSNKQRFYKPIDENYNGIILFAATYKDVPSAEHAFQVLKTRTQIRMSDIEGQSGLRVEQVRIFERIRDSGGLLTQKDKHVFYLVESCEKPPVCKNWNDYENLFLSFITEKKEEIEVINADCKKDIFLIQKNKSQ